MKYLMLMAFALAMFTACTKDYPEPIIDVNGGNDTVSFTNKILPIFVSNCVSCHGKGAIPPELTTTKAYDQLVNSSKKYVDTAKPTESLLYKKVNVGGTMNTYIKSSDISLILKWIEQGAKNN